ncbi:hypothetical protein [Hymenobacter glacieicola]|uniref:Zinc ribbon domain-containing protein n=1 Tax=Hymenobacter glacieicola TaxID=1562124 RepID=A0ABQ1WQ39_9BACT|nr:hypothetical protein [Hymenobacter glacieicola]GGG36246.1 hypothetical protein GCM10011378_10720 [Hymenobacter glacieicola]
MKSDQSKSNVEIYWVSAFLVVPLVIAMQFGNEYTTDKGMKVLYSGLAGLVVGPVGFAGYYFTNKRSFAVRIAVLASVIVISALPTILLSTHDKALAKNGTTYSTCPVCGYIAFNAREKSCDNCGEELTEEEMHESGFASMNSLVRLDQIFYLIPDDEKTAVSFEQPAISEDGYMLDKSWRPIVSKAEVEREAVKYYEHRRKHPIKVEILKR